MPHKPEKNVKVTKNFELLVNIKILERKFQIPKHRLFVCHLSDSITYQHAKMRLFNAKLTKSFICFLGFSRLNLKTSKRSYVSSLAP